uniref:Uncharacterized protein n=1 Tax=Solanum lycopersicum TaxID=4081 RepID=A0A3Q7J3D5_SOLLC
MPNFFVDVRQDHVYAYGWPSRLFRPIWKLAITACPTHLEVQMSPEASIPLISTLGDPDSDVKNAKFFVDVHKDLVYAYGLQSQLVRPIWKIKRAPKRAYPSFRRFSCAIAHHFLGDPDSDVKNTKFLRGRPSRPCLCIRLAITACPTHLEAHHFLGDPDSDVKNFKFFRGRLSRPCLCIRLAITAYPTHLEGQTIPEASIPLISTIFVCYNAPFLGDQDSDVKNVKFFCGRPSRPSLCIRLAITACPTHLEAHHYLDDPDSDVKNVKFFRGRPSRPCLCIRLAITACPTQWEGWPSRLVRPIWKVKRAPKRAYPSFRRFSCAIAHHFLGDPNSEVKKAKFFCGRPSRLCLRIRLDITACPTHLEGQTSPEASIPLISMIFVCHLFLGDPNSDFKNAKFFRRRPSRPCLCIRLAITACPTHLEDVRQDLIYAYEPRSVHNPSIRRFSCAIAHHFLGDPDSDVKMPNFFVDVRQDLVYAYGWPSRLVRPIWKVKRAPMRAYPSFRRFSCAIAHHFLGDPDSDVKNAKFFRGRPSSPCLCIRLTITACPTHLEDLFYAYGWPSRLFRPIWKVKRAPKRACPSFRRFSCAIAHHFLCDPNFDVKNAKFFRGLRQDLFYAYGWPSRLF